MWEGEDFLRCSSTLSSIPLIYVRFEVLAAEFMKIQNFLGYDAMSFVNRYRCFGGGCCFYLQGPRGLKIQKEFLKFLNADIEATHSSEMSGSIGHYTWHRIPEDIHFQLTLTYLSQCILMLHI
jgi:hypothetical protein